MTDLCWEKLLTELGRLQKQPFGSAESAVLRSYLDTVLELPWGKKNEEIRDRVDRVRMQPLFLYSMRNRDKAREDGRWDELVALMKKYDARPRESQTLEAFLQSDH